MKRLILSSLLLLFCAPGLAVADRVTVTVDVSGAKPRTASVDIGPSEPVDVTPPTTQPTDPDVETPPPSTQPSDPLSPVAYPALYPFTTAPGTDLSKLTQPAVLADGDYVTSGDIRQPVVALHPGKAVLRLKAKQTPQLPDIFAGVFVTDGGLPDNDDVSKAGPKAGALVHSCTFYNGEGFGLIITRAGQVRVTQSHFFNNGSGGIGGTNKAGDYLIDYSSFKGNNVKYGRKNSNKFTRAKVTFDRCDFDGNAGVDVWADNYVQLLTVTRSTFANCKPDKTGNSWTAANVKAEISGQFLVKDCDFTNDVTASVAVDEVLKGTVIEGNRFRGKSPEAIELRDLARSGYSLRDVTIRNNVYEGPGALAVGPSNAGTAVGQARNNIVVDATNLWPDGKPHVTVKK